MRVGESVLLNVGVDFALGSAAWVVIPDLNYVFEEEGDYDLEAVIIGPLGTGEELQSCAFAKNLGIIDSVESLIDNDNPATHNIVLRNIHFEEDDFVDVVVFDGAYVTTIGGYTPDVCSSSFMITRRG